MKGKCKEEEQCDDTSYVPSYTRKSDQQTFDPR